MQAPGGAVAPVREAPHKALNIVLLAVGNLRVSLDHGNGYLPDGRVDHMIVPH